LVDMLKHKMLKNKKEIEATNVQTKMSQGWIYVKFILILMIKIGTFIR
jgi:hypothetical protein